MRITTVLFVLFLLFASSFILRTLFVEEENNPNEQVVKQGNGFKDTQNMLEEEQSLVFSSSVSESAEEKATFDEAISRQASIVKPLTAEEKQYNRSVVNEQRKIKSAERRRYLKERREWHIAMNHARKEAIDSGDNTEYELLKAQEPTKRVRSGDYAEYEALELEEKPTPSR